MSSTFKNWLFVLSLLTIVAACSNDSSDSTDSKGDAQNVVHSNAQKVCAQEEQSEQINSARLDCYQDLLNADDRIINDLRGHNPFLLKSWDDADTSKGTVYSAKIDSCRAQFPVECVR